MVPSHTAILDHAKRMPVCSTNGGALPFANVASRPQSIGRANSAVKVDRSWHA